MCTNVQRFKYAHAVAHSMRRKCRNNKNALSRHATRAHRPLCVPQADQNVRAHAGRPAAARPPPYLTSPCRYPHSPVHGIGWWRVSAV